MTTPPSIEPAAVTDDDRYEWLFARNWDSVENRIGNALFCLTTLVWDEQTKVATVAELNDALAILRKLRETWQPRTRTHGGGDAE